MIMTTIHDKHEVINGMLMNTASNGPALGEFLTKIEYAIVDGELANEKKPSLPISSKQKGGKMRHFIVR